jgi:Zn-dependent M28 family amino/carboxypeptidase
VGRKSKKKVFYGADDNASGTSALLQVARAFADPEAPRPRRSILFLWCTAEERGLLGSKHFVDNPTVPVAAMVANLNIDMVGRNSSKEMHVYGNASSPDLDAAHNRAAEISGFRFLAKTGSIFLRSDQVNFYRRDIPCLFFTSGLHKDYHATSDTAARIDTGKASRAALHAYLTAWEIANRTERPRFVKMDERASSGPLAAVLDLVPRENLPDRVQPADGCGAALVRTVMDGGPAAEAGLQPGDFILEVDGKDLPEDDPVGAVEEAVAQADKRVVLRIARGTRTIKVTVKVG